MIARKLHVIATGKKAPKTGAFSESVNASIL